MKYCCINCFDDSYIKELIKSEGVIANCDYCKSKNVKCIEPSELACTFDPLIDIYKPVEDFMMTYDLKRHDGDFIWEKPVEGTTTGIVEYGCDVKQLNEILPLRRNSIVYKDANGESVGVNWKKLVPPLIKQVQNLSVEVDSLNEKIKTLEKKVDKLEKKLTTKNKKTKT